MPIYEYRCQECGHELETMQRISAEPLTDCPSCETPALRRLISQTSFVLKGSGWYATDYAKKGKGASSSKPGSNGSSSDSEKSGSSADSGGSSSSVESKPAKASGSKED